MARHKPTVEPVKNAPKILQATEPQAQLGAPADVNELPATGLTRPVGIGLKASEIEALDAIARETGIARNSLGRFAIREFIKAYRRGEIDLSRQIEQPPPPKKRLRM
jgi:hypothetical protein